MPFYEPDVVAEAKKLDLLTYLQNYEPQELVHVSGNVYCTKTHDSLRISNRIVEKFKLVAENTASIKSEIEKSRESRGGEQTPPEQAAPQKSEEDKLVDEMLEKPAQKEKGQPENPSAEKADSFSKAAEKSPPSAPTSENSSRHAEGTSNPPKKSVREELREIQAARKQEAELPHEEKTTPAKKAAQKTSTHKQPPKKRKSKSKER